MARVRFVSETEPAVERSEPARNWSDLEMRLSELSKPLPVPSRRVASEPYVTLAHDPHDPIALLEALNAQNRVISSDRLAKTDALRPTEQAPLRVPTQAAESLEGRARKQDPLDVFSLLATIPPKQS